MKHVLPTLLAVVCALTACKTTSDRFDLYSPDKPQGPATQKLRGMTLAGRYNHQSNTYTVPVTGSIAPQPPAPPEEGGAIAPPPPPPPMPETNVGAPAATPLPSITNPGPGVSSTVIPGTSAPVTTPTTGSEPTGVPGLTTPTTTTPAPAAPGAPAGAATPAPPIPGLTQ